MRDRPWYTYLLLALIVFGLFYLLYYKPKGKHLTALREERIKTEQEVAELRAKKSELDQIEAELRVMDNTLRELEAIIPQKKEISDILRKIQQLAFDSRLTIVKFIPQGEVDKEFYSEWPISIEITGNYHNLAVFFDRLSHFSRLFTVEDFTIASLKNQSDASTISATWTAKTYIFREEEPALESTKKQ
ncbi:MAG: type 4a pilus biogenesis protein PilO [Candidatus Aminicenantes bacterium]